MSAQHTRILAVSPNTMSSGVFASPLPSQGIASPFFDSSQDSHPGKPSYLFLTPPLSPGFDCPLVSLSEDLPLGFVRGGGLFRNHPPQWMLDYKLQIYSKCALHLLICTRKI